MSAHTDLTRDEALALLSMSGGVPAQQQGWLARHRTSEVHQLAQSARAKLIAIVDERPDDERFGAKGAEVRLIALCDCTGEQLERGQHCDSPNCPNRPA